VLINVLSILFRSDIRIALKNIFNSSWEFVIWVPVKTGRSTCLPVWSANAKSFSISGLIS